MEAEIDKGKNGKGQNSESSNKSVDYKSKIIDPIFFNSLNNDCKELIKNAENGDEECLLKVANNFLKGENSFPQNRDTAVKYFEYGVNSNKVKVIESYGVELFEGAHLAKDESKSVAILTIAAEKYDSAEAKYQLANIILSHQVFELDEKANWDVNFPLAKKYSKEAADSGHVKSMVLYGSLSVRHKISSYGEIKANHKESFKYFKMASDHGDAQGMFRYAHLLENGFGVTFPNKEAAFKLFKKSYELGSVSAQSYYASIMIIEKCGESDEREATRLLKLACEQNEGYSLNCYGVIMFNGSKYIPKDEAASFDYFKRAANLGITSGFRNVGICYAEGKPVEKNIDLAIKYLKFAIDEGSFAAAYNLARLYLYGDEEANFPVDAEKARYYMKIAADGGIGGAICDYGEMLFIQSKKDEMWKNYLEDGMEFKSIDCMNYYTALFLDGEFAPKDLEKVTKYIKYAADHDKNPQAAMEMYAEIVENGYGVPKDEKEAKRYIRKSKKYD